MAISCDVGTPPVQSLKPNQSMDTTTIHDFNAG